MGLLADVASLLDKHEVSYAVFGATAMAFHGYMRFTSDIDLLTIHPDTIQDYFWRSLQDDQTDVEARSGDDSDPRCYSHCSEC